MVQTTSPLIFWAGTDAVPGALADYLTSLAPQRSSLQMDLQAASEDLANSPKASLVLLYRSCETSLAQVLQNGTDPAQLLQIWTDETQALLAMQRQNRRRCLLIEADHFLRFASAGLSRLDLPAEALTDLPEPVKPDPVSLLIAQNLLAEHPRALALAEEIEAATTSLSNEEAPRAPLPAELAVQAHLDRHARSTALKADLVQAQQDAARAEPRLTAAHAEAAQASLEAEAQRTRRTELEAEFERVQHSLTEQTERAAGAAAQTAALRAQIEADSAARALMLDDLRQMERAQAEAQRHLNSARTQITQQQDQLSSLRGDLEAKTGEIAHLHGTLQTIEGDLAARGDHIHHLEGELDRIWRSTSMRLTAPLRRIMGLLRPGRANADTNGDRHD